MALTERKKKVLRSIVDLYIRTAEPVGSKAIAALPDMKYSSATIRNEMAELTTLGYLEQPHTSAGRIPSAAGYRLYVDELMMDYRLSIDETKSINVAIEEKMQRVDKMVEKVAKLVSQATNLPAISAASRSSNAVVKRFDLIYAGMGSFILVLMMPGDQVVNKLIKLPLNVEESDLKLLSAVLNAAMTDIPAKNSVRYRYHLWVRILYAFASLFFLFIIIFQRVVSKRQFIVIAPRQIRRFPVAHGTLRAGKTSNLTGSLTERGSKNRFTGRELLIEVLVVIVVDDPFADDILPDSCRLNRPVVLDFLVFLIANPDAADKLRIHTDKHQVEPVGSRTGFAGDRQIKPFKCTCI